MPGSGTAFRASRAGKKPLESIRSLRQKSKEKEIRTGQGPFGWPGPMSQRGIQGSGFAFAKVRVQRQEWRVVHGSSYLRTKKVSGAKPCAPLRRVLRHGLSANPFGSLATWQSLVTFLPRPWLCAPASQRVCHFEDKEATSLRCGQGTWRFPGPRASNHHLLRR